MSADFSVNGGYYQWICRKMEFFRILLEFWVNSDICRLLSLWEKILSFTLSCILFFSTMTIDNPRIFTKIEAPGIILLYLRKLKPKLNASFFIMYSCTVSEMLVI